MLERVLDALAFPERAVHRTVLSSVLLMVVLSNGLGVPLFLLLRPPEGLQSLPGFLLAALPLELVLIAFVGLAWRVRATRAGEGLAWPPLGQLPVWVFFGLLAEGDDKALQCRVLKIDEDDHFTRLLRTCAAETIGGVTVKEVP